MLEVVAAAPCVVAYLLARKLWDQQTQIDERERLIGDLQRTVEQAIQSKEGGSRSVAVAVGGVVALCALTAHFTRKLAATRQNISPPQQYEPTLATVEAEECVVCLTHRRDTFFSPCQHYTACWPCSLQCSECPICRARVEYRQFVFIP